MPTRRAACVHWTAVACTAITLAGCRSEFERPSQLPPNARVTGTITHAGKPLPDAEVTYPIISHAYTSYVTRTDAHGSFALDVNTRGRGLLWIRHASGLATDREIELAPGEQSTHVEIDVGASGRIGGVVVGADGRPLVRVRAWITGRDTRMSRTVVTTSDGRFAVTSVEVGHTYDVKLTNGHTGKDVMLEVTLDAAHPNVDNLRAVLGPQDTIHGVAVDEAGAPVRGASLIGTDPTFMEALGKKTDITGYFEWAPVLDGPHAILLKAPDGRVGSADKVTAADSPLRITLYSPGKIRVVCSGFRLGRFGKPEIVSGERVEPAQCGETVDDFPPGAYQVTGMVDAGQFVGTTVTVRPGVTTDAILELRPTGTITGVAVSYPDGSPLVGMKCDTEWPSGIVPIAGHFDAISDDDGRFELRVSGGRLGVTCSDPASRYSDGYTALELDGEARVTVQMVRRSLTEVDMGVAFEEEPGGARITRVAKAAAVAGLRRGDLVLAIDGVSLTGLGHDAIYELAFALPLAAAGTWTVERAGTALELRTVAK